MPRVTIEEVLNCTEWKTCTKCGDEKKLVMFSRSGEGYRPSCKQCDAKAYQARKANKIEQVQVKAMSKLLASRIIKWIFS